MTVDVRPSGASRPGAALADFTAETNLAAEHRRLMDEHHRPVDWSRSTADQLSPTLRDGIADLWRQRMISEHRSVAIFSMYVLDLLAAGAPAEVLSLACRAQVDEVRHAELFTRLTSIYSGKPETPPPGIPPMPDDPSISNRLYALREALHLSCGSETFSTVLLSELRDRATDPVVRDVLAVVVSDELYHARMGWAFLASLLAPGAAGADEVRAFLQGEVLKLLDDLVKAMFGDPRKIPPPSVPEAERALAAGHGYMPGREEYALFKATIRDVWVPGFAMLGLDAKEALGRYPDPE